MSPAIDHAQSLPPGFAIAAEARAISDTATIRMEDYKVDGHLSWVILRVIPDAQSGSVTVPGLSINGATGETTPPTPGTVPQTIVSGSWKVLASSTAPASPVGHYHWSIPLTEERRVVMPDDIYSPFIHGGTVLARPVGDPHGTSPFAAVRLIFADWAQRMAEEARAQQPLAGEKNTLDDADPLNALTALRRELQDRALRPLDVTRALRPSEPERRAVVTFLLLMSANDALLAPLYDVVRAAHSSADLSPVVLGAFAACLFSSDRKVMSRAVAVARAAAERLTDLRIEVDPGSELGLIFSKLRAEP